MNQVLTQSEVDALLNAVMEGEIDELSEDEAEGDALEPGSGPSPVSAPGAKDKSRPIKVKGVVVKPYDLANQDRIMRGKMPMLEVLHDKFCRDFRTIMSLDLRRMVDVEPAGIELIKMKEFLQNLSSPACLSLFTMEPLTGSGVITFDSDFIFLMVDLFCGGLGRTRYRVEGREFTSIEQGIVGKVAQRALKVMKSAWAPVIDANIRFNRTEVNSQFINIAHPTEIIVRFSASVDVEGVSGSMAIVLPYSMIEPLKDRLSKGVLGERVELERVWKKNMQQKIIESDVEITGVLGMLTMPIGRLMALKKGDIVELETDLDEPLRVEVEGRPKFYGRSGIHKGNKALQILGEIE